ncbi:MAG TPA: hotdog domain-containing protein [Roseateles sp.]|nr:hotdog domain-containing protein [Roseateles sp.]
MNQDLSIVSLILHASFAVQLVIAGLLLVSLASWSVIFVVAATSLRYLAPARLDDLLTVTVEPEPAGRASLVVRQRALRGDTLLAEGEIRIGCVRANDLKPQRLPDAVVQAITSA